MISDENKEVDCCPELSFKPEVRIHGSAIDYVFIQNGKMFASNTEYCNQINYCPFCGSKAPIQMTPITNE